MIASVTDLQEYRRSHPPALKLWNAQCRFASEWSVAWFKMWLLAFYNR